MKTLALESKDISLDALVDLALEETVVVTRDNKPLLVVAPVDEEDLETWRLGENPEFLELMRRSWQRLNDEGAMDLEEARQRLLD